MCGRYSITTPPEALRRLFRFNDLPNLQPRYNMAPKQMAPVVRDRDGVRHLDLLRWGLLPSWARDVSIGAKLINARLETIAEKPSFRDAFKKRRCLVPADGFYEWRKCGKLKKPHRVCIVNGGAFAFAGLWERWCDPANQHAVIETFTVATTVASSSIAHIHHRMPVILDPSDYNRWLAGDPENLLQQIKPFPDERLYAYEVSPRVGNVRNDDWGLLEAIGADDPSLF
ncbi:MAG: DUF159 family protein [Rhodospirillaceae bacterium]|nr:DUF159 family protein [Rhodospirillaceae bacterium]